MLVEPSEKEVATTLDLSVMMFACQSMGNLTTFQTKINLTKIQTSSTSVRFPGVWWGGHVGRFFSKVKDKLLHPGPPTTKKEAWHLLSLFGFGGQHSPHLGCVAMTDLLSDLKESESHSVVSNSWQSHGLFSPWNSPGQNTGVGSVSLLQGILPIQGLNSCEF